MGRLHRDEGGAVMVTGVFMASFLVGALWYVMGIGDAIVFRDRMQEAADHAAFTSAALHAKGMNFIAAMNIVMLALVAVHMILGLIHDVALAVCILTVGTGCGFWAKEKKIYDGYAKFMKPAVAMAHVLEETAAIGYPWIGAWKGGQLGGVYKTGKVTQVTTVAVSPSMLPGRLYKAKRVGLPVMPRRREFLCEKIGNVAYDFAKDNNLLLAFGGVTGALVTIFSNETVDSILKRITGKVLSLRYCNAMDSAVALGAMEGLNRETIRGQEAIASKKERDAEAMGVDTTKKPGAAGTTKNGTPKATGGAGVNVGVDPGFDPYWGKDGPHVVVKGAENGSATMQVWGMAVNPRYRDEDERRVKVASRQAQTSFHTYEGPPLYYAQAEFYFDCTDKWDEDVCNGKSLARDDNAMFAIKWRARLKRVVTAELREHMEIFTRDGSAGLEEAMHEDIAFADILDKGPVEVLGQAALQMATSKLLGTLLDRVFDGPFELPAVVRETYH